MLNPRYLKELFSSFPTENVYIIKNYILKKHILPEHRKASTCAHITPIRSPCSCHIKNAESVANILPLFSMMNFCTLLLYMREASVKP